MRTRLRSVGLIGLLALATSMGCEFARGSNAVAPSNTSEGSASNGSNTSFIGTWTSAVTSDVKAALPDPKSCSNFTWNVAAQTATSASGTFSLTCLGSITVSGTASGAINGSNVTITVSGSGNLPAVGACAFALTGNGTIAGDVLTIPYTGTTCLGPVSGTETLRKNQVLPTPPAPQEPAPTPPPAPPPPPTPAPPPSFGPDGIDMGQAVILNSPRDLASWPITTTITELNIRSSGIRVEFSKKDGPGRWPDVTPPGWSGPLQYTLGMCLNINARWYCSAVVEFWHELEESGGPPSQYAQNWFYDPIRWAPMTGHQPAQGETIGFFVCGGDCRNNVNGDLSPARERSNIVLVPMPGNGGANYRF
jgi:hypothetical protein